MKNKIITALSLLDLSYLNPASKTLKIDSDFYPICSYPRFLKFAKSFIFQGNIGKDERLLTFLEDNGVDFRRTPRVDSTLFYTVFGDARFWRVMWRNGNENDGARAGAVAHQARNPATAGNQDNRRYRCYRHFLRHRLHRHRRRSTRYSDQTLVLAPCRPVPLESYVFRQS